LFGLFAMGFDPGAGGDEEATFGGSAGTSSAGGGAPFGEASEGLFYRRILGEAVDLSGSVPSGVPLTAGTDEDLGLFAQLVNAGRGALVTEA
jgi:hypothetical protein